MPHGGNRELGNKPTQFEEQVLSLKAIPESTRPLSCQICGRTNRRACGLLEFTGHCGLPDPRWAESTVMTSAPTAETRHNPMHQMAAARVALARLKPCGARSKRTGLPCQRPPCRGSTRCNLHGGRSTGAPVISGRRTLQQRRLTHYLWLLMKALAVLHGKLPQCDRTNN